MRGVVYQHTASTLIITMLFVYVYIYTIVTYLFDSLPSSPSTAPTVFRALSYVNLKPNNKRQKMFATGPKLGTLEQTYLTGNKHIY